MSPPETGRRRAFGGIDGPMSALELGILGLYFLTLVILAIMGVHRYVMVYLYFKHREKKAAPVPLPERLPRVTIQLPIFNEMYVLDRLLESVVQIRLPARAAADPGARRLDRRDDRDRQPRGRTLSRARLRHRSTCTAPTAPATRPARSTRA